VTTRDSVERTESYKGSFRRLRVHLAQIPHLFSAKSRPNAKLQKLGEDIGARVLLEPRAGVILESFPDEPLSRVLGAVARWAENVDVRWVRVSAIPEPEDPSWTEVALKIAVTADFESGTRLLREVSEQVELVKAGMDHKTRALFDGNFAVHVLWGAFADAALESG
jgi:hypothetical protein